MSRRKKLLIGMWAAFGGFWALMAAMTAINPVIEPQNWPHLIVILEIGLVVLCALVIVRVIRSSDA
jgi:hypothetical protein